MTDRNGPAQGFLREDRGLLQHTSVRVDEPRDAGIRRARKGNMILYGTGDPIEALGVLAPHVITVHAKDGDWPPAGVA